MKKLVSMLIVLAMLVAGVSAFAAEMKIALITDVGNIDDMSFNQSSWEGVVAFGDANNVAYEYYRPSEDSTSARVETMKTAISNGANTLVCPGYLFEDSVYEVQKEYPDVNFLILDGTPHSADYADYYTAPNTSCILYHEEQAGYFAGYAAVKDGYTKLGFLGGMEVPAVQRFGFGFVQGADAAAKEMGVNVEIKYWYSGLFVPSDDIKNKMSAWNSEGTEVVFACGGGIYLSALAAAEEADTVLIGVDRDQAHDSERVITSAVKDLKNSVILAMEALLNNDGVWPEAYAGKTANLGVAEDCVGLPTAETSWRLNTYTVEEYNALFAQVKSGEVVVSDALTAPETTNAVVDYQN